MYVVALNAERKGWHREERRAARAAVHLDGSAEPLPDIATGAADAVSLRGALDALTDRQRTAIVLRYLADLPVVEIACVMGCAEGTVKATLHQSLAKLRVELAEEQLRTLTSSDELWTRWRDPSPIFGWHAERYVWVRRRRGISAVIVAVLLLLAAIPVVLVAWTCPKRRRSPPCR